LQSGWAFETDEVTMMEGRMAGGDASLNAPMKAW
jgi:hypothetical protein